MLTELKSLIEKYDATSVYLNGDIKHTITVDSPFNWEVIPAFIETLSDMAEVVVIPGNHDGDIEALLPRGIRLTDVRGVTIDDSDISVGVLHGHAWPSPEVLETQMLVVGHTHPAVKRLRVVAPQDSQLPERIRSAGIVPVVIRSQLDKTCVLENIGEKTGDETSLGSVITLPAFNPLIKGTSVNMSDSDLFGPLYDNECADVESSEVYSLEGILLGSVKFLRQRLGSRNH
jgi:metallophosphoesterase superfamily enzyme